MSDPTRPLHTPAEAQGPLSSASGRHDDTAPHAGGGDPTFGPPAEAGEVGTLGPYRVVKRLGAGGMGAVYLAVDTTLDRPLALKVMLPESAADAQAKERFLREARAAAQVSHDNVVTVYEADERDGVPYIAMQLLRGCPLDQYLKRRGNLTLSQVLGVARDAALGLAAAHEQGLVHRDIKPANLWLEAPRGRTKVLDFGLAKPMAANADLTRTGAVIGTPAFMSPEQARGLKVDHRTDLFSLGAVLYRLCAGRNPFTGPNTMAVLMALGTEDPPPVRDLNPQVPTLFAEVIHKLLAKEPDDRPQTALALVEWLDAIESGTAVITAAGRPAQPPAAPSAPNPFGDLDATDLDATDLDATAAEPAERPEPPRKKRGRAALFAGGAAALLAAAATVASVLSGGKEKPNADASVPTLPLPTVAPKKVEPKAAPKAMPKPEPDPDRKAAEWVLSLGGAVRVRGGTADLRPGDDLPAGRWTLEAVHLDNKRRLTDADLAPLRDLADVRFLSVTSAPVGDPGLEHVARLKGLQTLFLHRTAVTDAGMARLAELPALRQLHLDSTPVGDEGMKHLAALQSLFHFSLVATKVTDAGLAPLKDCRALRNLILWDTEISDAGLARLEEFPALSVVSVNRTKVTADGVAKFRAARPNCKVEWDEPK